MARRQKPPRNSVSVTKTDFRPDVCFADGVKELTYEMKDELNSVQIIVSIYGPDYSNAMASIITPNGTSLTLT